MKENRDWKKIKKRQQTQSLHMRCIILQLSENASSTGALTRSDSSTERGFQRDEPRGGWGARLWNNFVWLSLSLSLSLPLTLHIAFTHIWTHTLSAQQMRKATWRPSKLFDAVNIWKWTTIYNWDIHGYRLVLPCRSCWLYIMCVYLLTELEQERHSQ